MRRVRASVAVAITLWLASQAKARDLGPDLIALPAAAQRVTPQGPAPWQLAWRQPTVRTGTSRSVRESFGQPCISERHKRVIVATAEGAIVAFGLDSAAPIWRHAYGAALETATYLVPLGGRLKGDELVLVGTRDSTLLALDVATGQLVWQADIDGEVRAAPRLCDGVLVVTTSANKVSVIEQGTGQVVWSAGRPAPTGLSVEGHARATVAGGRVFVSFSDGFGAAYSLKDGALLWSRPLSLRGGSFVDADADPYVFGEQVVMASYTDGIYGLDVKDGQTRWNQPALAVSTLAGAGTQLFAGSSDGWVAALDGRGGAVQWRTQVQGMPLSRLVLDGQAVHLIAGQTGLVSLSQHSGKPQSAAAVHERVANDMATTSQYLAFVSASGHLYLWQRVDAKHGDAARRAYAKAKLGRDA